MKPLEGAWPWSRLGDVADPVRLGLQTDQAPVLTFKGLRQDGQLELGDPEKGRFARAAIGDVVLTKQGHVEGWVLKKVGLVKTTGPIHVAGTLQVVRARPSVTPQWLYHWLAAPSTYELVQEMLGARNSLTAETLRAIPIPRPSMEEQRRIVDILEDHLSRLDQGRSSLTTVARKTVALRESWMRRQLGVDEDADWARIGELLVDARGGWSRSRRHLVAPEVGTPYLKMNNITRDGELLLDEVCAVSGSSEEVSRYQVLPGDVLFNSKNSGDLIGKTAVANEAVAGWTFNENIMRLRFDSHVLLPKYVGIWFQGPVMRSRIREAASASTNVAAVYMHHLREMPVWVPDLETQSRLVMEFDALTQAGKRLAEDSRLLARRAALLRRSLLEAAFSGRLTGRSSDLDRVEELAGV